jgi:hypothetical protein
MQGLGIKENKLIIVEKKDPSHAYGKIFGKYKTVLDF